MLNAYLVITFAPSAVTEKRPHAFGRGVLGKAEALRRKAFLEDLYPDLVVEALPFDQAVSRYDVYV